MSISIGFCKVHGGGKRYQYPEGCENNWSRQCFEKSTAVASDASIRTVARAPKFGRCLRSSRRWQAMPVSSFVMSQTQIVVRGLHSPLRDGWSLLRES
jgi:hypothetical protein